MKRIYTLLFLTTIVLGTVISCNDDNSTFASSELPNVVIDTTGMSELSILQFEELSVTPNLKMEGVSESNLSFEWRLYFIPDDTLSEVISTKRNLEGYKIELTPTTDSDIYRVAYTVTDNTTGLEYIMSWPLYVLNSLGEGLVVAETADGANTDLSLIMAPQVTSDYSDVTIRRDVYSAINGEYISGLVKDILFTSLAYSGSIGPGLMAVTDNSIIHIDRTEFTYEQKNDDLFFYIPPEGFNSQSLGIVNENGLYTVYAANDDLFGANLTSAGKFEAPLDSDFMVPNEIAINEQPLAPTIVSFYDEENEQFVFLGTFTPFGGTNQLTAVPAASGGAFNPASVSGKENIAADAGDGGNFRHLLRDKKTGDYHLYILDGNDPPAPLNRYDFSDAPEIENAEYFVLPENQKVMYYATKTKIYAALYSTATPVFELRYEVPAGEEITTLQLYHEADYPTGGPYIATNNRQLVMSTYNGSEGKVYLLPIVNLGVGNIDESNITTFGGFDRITAITPQK